MKEEGSSIMLSTKEMDMRKTEMRITTPMEKTIMDWPPLNLFIRRATRTCPKDVHRRPHRKKTIPHRRGRRPKMRKDREAVMEVNRIIQAALAAATSGGIPICDNNMGRRGRGCIHHDWPL